MHFFMLKSVVVASFDTTCILFMCFHDFSRSFQIQMICDWSDIYNHINGIKLVLTNVFWFENKLTAQKSNNVQMDYTQRKKYVIKIVIFLFMKKKQFSNLILEILFLQVPQ